MRYLAVHYMVKKHLDQATQALLHAADDTNHDVRNMRWWGWAALALTRRSVTDFWQRLATRTRRYALMQRKDWGLSGIPLPSVRWQKCCARSRPAGGGSSSSGLSKTEHRLVGLLDFAEQRQLRDALLVGALEERPASAFDPLAFRGV